MVDKRPSDEFHIYYEKNQLWKSNFWLGVPCWQYPLDVWILQELIFKLRPEYIIESGTAHGGSALLFASLMNMVGYDGKVVTIDIDDRLEKDKWSEAALALWDTRVYTILGSSIDPIVCKLIHEFVKQDTCIVVLDSWHTKEHVLKELEMYHGLVKPNYYIIVEDTHVNGNPIEWKWGDGPMEAVNDFLIQHKNFESDKTCERLIMTFNPNGWLRRTV